MTPSIITPDFVTLPQNILPQLSDPRQAESKYQRGGGGGGWEGGREGSNNSNERSLPVPPVPVTATEFRMVLGSFALNLPHDGVQF